MDAIEIHGVSQHFYKPLYADHWCEENPGIGVVGNAIYGIYKNSECGTSLYIGKRFKFNPMFGIDLGIVSGYKTYPILPIITPYITKYNFSIRLLPEVLKSGKIVIGGISLSYIVKINE